jgi:hypothetical protein
MSCGDGMVFPRLLVLLLGVTGSASSARAAEALEARDGAWAGATVEAEEDARTAAGAEPAGPSRLDDALDAVMPA